MPLRYYLTFIDEVPEAPSRLRRAASCERAHVGQEEHELCEQVARLADRAALLTPLTRLALPRPAAAAPAQALSRGHPELCRRPCVHFARQGCPQGADCVYCHLPHPERAVSLDKRSRELVAALAPRSLLALLLPLLRARVDAMADGGSAALRARAFLLALEQEAVQLGPPTPPECQKIVKRLKLMTFAMLMGLIVRCPAPSVALVAEEALEEMRRL
ncbi:unnamed protein product [Effrenium voratum]|uniref:C3H1-type domain-containing protein n=1 Tax=Effrenium voratum TaxID=2562239 RepID=A0AA36N9W2_9DINO|nr:unnamed protein product [Effrenium voratum]CAJ1460541.1 unnamed protein product [Effrenium voratum]